MDTAPSGSDPGVWLRNPGQLPGASKHKNLLEFFTHGIPGYQNLSNTVKVSVRSLCQVSAWELPWMGLGRRSGQPKNEMSLKLHTPHLRSPKLFWGGRKFG